MSLNGHNHHQLLLFLILPISHRPGRSGTSSPRLVCASQVRTRSCLPAGLAGPPPLRAADWLPLMLWLDGSIIIRYRCGRTVPIGPFMPPLIARRFCRVVAPEGMSLSLSSSDVCSRMLFIPLSLRAYLLWDYCIRIIRSQRISFGATCSSFGAKQGSETLCKRGQKCDNCLQLFGYPGLLGYAL